MRMTAKSVPGRLEVAADAAQVARFAAARIAAVLKDAAARRGAATLALSGGSTPRQAYAQLATQAELDWSTTSVFWVDERAVAPTDDWISARHSTSPSARLAEPTTIPFSPPDAIVSSVRRLASVPTRASN